MLQFFKNLLQRRRKFDFYLGGPMRGYKDLNRPMFDSVSKLLRSKGFTVWSPSEHESYIKVSFAQCMTADLNAVINNCNRIALLPGWRNSLGANMEAFVAFACGKIAHEVMLTENGSDLILVPFDCSMYVLPYRINEEIRKFNPHLCELDSFNEK